MTLTSFPLSNFNFAFADLVSLEVACLLLHSFATVLEGELLRGARISYTTEGSGRVLYRESKRSR